jgi:glutathione S-transferase
MLTLYFAPGTSSMAPHIALHEIGVSFEARSMGPGMTRQPEYRALNPEGKVPTLTVDGRPMTEVAAILFYLARRFPEAGLLPGGGIEAEAQAISWMSYLASSVHPARRQGLDHAREVYALADARLGPRAWTVGSSYSIADIHLFRLFWRFSRSFDPPRAEFPNLFAHHDRILDRPAVCKTIEIESAIGYRLPA